MSSSFKLVSVITTLTLVLVACGGGPAASPTGGAPSGTPVATGTSAASPSATTAASPSASATESASPSGPAESPGESPAESPSESPATSPDGSPSPSPSPTPAPGAEEGTLTLWVDETRAPILTELGAEFEEATGTPVIVYQVGFGDIRTQLGIRGPAGEGPDVIIGAHDWLGELVTNGLLQPLDLGAKASSFDPVALEAFTYDGVLYGMPYAAEAIALYYNPDLVPTPPATWEELAEMAATLQEEEDLDQAFVLQEKDPYHSYPILTAHGGYIFGETDEGYDPTDVGLDSEGGLAYAQFLDQMVKDGLLRAGVNYDTMIQLFTTGESAMFMTGPWALPQIRESGARFDVAPIPAGTEEARPFVGVQGFMVSADSPNQLLAQTFLTEYVATDETFASLFEADPRPSTWLAQAEATDDEQVQAFIESASNGDPLPAIPEMASVWTDWTDALDLIFTQGQDAEQAMRDAAESIRGLIGTE
jgi:maltose/maltodextrin transport system substrate-binding protein/arabinogalactan oligomer/maltooligosaccharide transport system substrate-binding protein